ncbi:MAG: hypothetical protein HYZ42_13545 [Bacteroidetes bacterium]|nr:hypothetical protein [Bacteroidota bacterium]
MGHLRIKEVSMSVSSNGLSACHIGEFEELNKAAFGTKFYFTDIYNRLIYYRKGAYLHELNDSGQVGVEPELLKWSKDGDSVYFLEYSFSTKSLFYWSTIIVFSERKIYRIDENVNKFSLVNQWVIKNNLFKTEEVLEKLSDNNIFGVMLE